MDTIKITKEQLDKLLSMNEPTIIVNEMCGVDKGDVLECPENHECYIITSCYKRFELNNLDKEYILPNPKNTVYLTNKARSDTWYFITLYRLEKLAGTMTINLCKKEEK